MADYRALYDQEYLGAWDFEGRGDVIVTIKRVDAKVLTSARGKNQKPVVYFESTPKGLVCNKTNGKAIAAMYGKDTTQWVGKRISLYATTTSAGGEVVDCVRVRPTPPPAAGRGRAAPKPAPQPEAPPVDSSSLPIWHPDASPPDSDKENS